MDVRSPCLPPPKSEYFDALATSHSLHPSSLDKGVRQLFAPLICQAMIRTGNINALMHLSSWQTNSEAIAPLSLR